MSVCACVCVCARARADRDQAEQIKIRRCQGCKSKGNPLGHSELVQLGKGFWAENAEAASHIKFQVRQVQCLLVVYRMGESPVAQEGVEWGGSVWVGSWRWR